MTYRLPLGVRVLISPAGLPAGGVRAVADDDELLPALTAWRVWPLGDGSEVDVARGVVTPLLRGVLYSRFTTYPLAWLGGRMTAACTPYSIFGLSRLTGRRQPCGLHAPPEDTCFCGIHACTDLRALLRMPRSAVGRFDVVGQGELTGRVVEGGIPRVDPPGTVRAAAGRVGPLLYVPEPLWPVIPAFERLHPWVTVHPTLAVGWTPTRCWPWPKYLA